VVVHICVCLVAICSAVVMLQQTPGSRPYAVVALCLTLAFGVLFPAMAWWPGLNVYDLSYRNFVAAFHSLDAGGSFAGPFNDQRLVTPLIVMMLLPTWLGIAAVLAMAGAAYAQLQRFPPPIGDTGRARATYAGAIWARLRRCCYLLSLVLVTSTIAASIFFHLPASFALPEKAAELPLIHRLDDYASELSVFWGCVYTVTLIAAVGVPMLLFQSRVGTRVEGLSADAEGEEEHKQLTETGILAGGTDQLKYVASCLAPLAAGPITNFIQVSSLFQG
jgi:hypothetical protein